MEIVGVWLLDEVGEYCRRACGWNRLYSGFWLAGICINSEHVQRSMHIGMLTEKIKTRHYERKKAGY